MLASRGPPKCNEHSENVVAKWRLVGFMCLIFLWRGRFIITPNGPSCGCRVPEPSKKTTDLSKV
ncbi:hypothetical protein Hanom_Chr02g00107231 [Helianthus anomalus]